MPSSWTDLELERHLLDVSKVVVFERNSRRERERENRVTVFVASCGIFFFFSFFFSLRVQRKGVSLSKSVARFDECLIGSSDSKMNFSSEIDVWIR